MNIVVPIGDFILRTSYKKKLLLWRKYDKLALDELERIQEENLKTTLQYAIKNVPYYSNIRYDDSLSAKQNLLQFPVLTKEILRNEAANLLSKAVEKHKLVKNYSSGSSGIQSFSYSLKENKMLLQAIQGHWYEWSGYKIGDPILQFGISPNRVFPKNIKDFFYKTHYVNAFSLTENDYKNCFDVMKQKKIKFILGYPSAINEFSKYLIKNNLSYKVEGIISLGDKLFEQFEKNFNSSFINPKIIDTYGCAEGLMMACRADKFYNIMAPHVYIEIVDPSNNRIDDGNLGTILVTDFNNLAQPFIRYKLGDLGIMLPKDEYPSNRKFFYPLLKKIVGRETDIVKTPNGKTLIVHSFTGVFEYFPEIIQFKIIQKDLNSIAIEYIPSDKLTQDILDSIKFEIDKITDATLHLNFIKVGHIQATPSGKPQIIQSFL